MTVLIAGGLVAAGLPYLLPRAQLTPLSGVTLWLLALVLRALVVVLMVIALIISAPASDLLGLVTDLCVHAVVPYFATHLGLSGHRLTHAATLVPAVLIAVSVVWAGFALWRAGRSVRGWVRNSTLGAGPRNSLVVGGAEVVVAAAGVREARIVVSTGALARLDDQELAAGLEHEHGHIVRRHPYLAVAANLLAAVGRLLPGSRVALSQLHFHLERDADEFAVRSTGDPLALASVICKVAAQGRVPNPALLGLSGVGAASRLRLLLDRESALPSAAISVASRGLAILLLTMVLGLAGLIPSLARAAIDGAPSAPQTALCPG